MSTDFATTCITILTEDIPKLLEYMGWTRGDLAGDEDPEVINDRATEITMNHTGSGVWRLIAHYDVPPMTFLISIGPGDGDTHPALLAARYGAESSEAIVQDDGYPVVRLELDGTVNREGMKQAQEYLELRRRVEKALDLHYTEAADEVPK